MLALMLAPSIWLWSQQPLPTPQKSPKQPVKVGNKAPKLEFETLTHDFGKSIQGQHLKCVFKFKNTGAATLNILKVKGG